MPAGGGRHAGEEHQHHQGAHARAARAFGGRAAWLDVTSRGRTAATNLRADHRQSPGRFLTRSSPGDGVEVTMDDRTPHVPARRSAACGRAARHRPPDRDARLARRAPARHGRPGGRRRAQAPRLGLHPGHLRRAARLHADRPAAPHRAGGPPRPVRDPHRGQPPPRRLPGVRAHRGRRLRRRGRAVPGSAPSRRGSWSTRPRSCSGGSAPAARVTRRARSCGPDTGPGNGDGQAGTRVDRRKSAARVVPRLDRATGVAPFSLVTESVVTGRCSGHPFGTRANRSSGRIHSRIANRLWNRASRYCVARPG